jgi:hypothetical protein
MTDRSSWDDFMLKKYEEAWTYIRYTYDVSNRMLWYAFSIIMIIGAVAGRLLVVGDGIQTIMKVRYPSSMDREEAHMYGFIFLTLFIAGLFIHAFYTFQRLIVDRQIKVIDHIRQYFIDQAKCEVDLERYLYFRSSPVPGGLGDVVAQMRLILPLFINSVTGTFSFMFFFRVGWLNIGSILFVLLLLAALQFLIINLMGYKALAKRIAPDVQINRKLKDQADR